MPEAELRHGDMMALPFADGTFDLVTGFTSFFFADDMVAALREAGRVARPGGPWSSVFGVPERCDLELVKHAVAPFRRRGEDGEEVRYWRPPAWSWRSPPPAGLTVAEAFTCTTAYEYPDEERFLAAMLSAGGAAAVAGPEREPELRAALVAGMAGCRRPDGATGWTTSGRSCSRRPLRLRRVEHAPQNAMAEPGEIARFHDRCSDLMRAARRARPCARASPDVPGDRGRVGWPRRRIALALGGVAACASSTSAAAAPTASTTRAPPRAAAGSCGWTQGRCERCGSVSALDQGGVARAAGSHGGPWWCRMSLAAARRHVPRPGGP